jgi:ribonuclease HII
MPFTERAIRGVTDSKQLSADARERLAPLIFHKALAYGIGAASVREVERHNILQATVRAMRRALGRLSVAPDMVLVDGRRLPTLGWEHEAIIGGDARCYSIACASIVAKVTRDRLMRSLAGRYPGYGWEHNVGYATAEHRAAIGKLGMTRHHRPSFLGLGAEPRGQTVLDLGETLSPLPRHLPQSRFGVPGDPSPASSS